MNRADAQARIDQAVVTMLARLEEADYNPTPLVDLGVLVAAADGHVDEGEVASLRALFARLYGTEVNAEVVSTFVEASRSVIQAAGVEARLHFLAEILLDCDAVEEGILIALHVAYSGEQDEPGNRPSARTLDLPERDVIVKLAKAADRDGRLVDELDPIARAAAGSASG